MFMKPKLLYSIIPIVFDLTFQRWNVWIVLLTLMSGTAAATRALAAEPSTVEHLLVAHRFAGEIVQFGANGREGIFAKDGLKAPGAVIAGPDGNIYVSDYERSAVVRYAPDGVALGTFASEGLDAPLGLLFDPSGNLLVVNYGSKNVVKIAPNGTRSAFITKGLDGPVSIVRTGQRRVSRFQFRRKQHPQVFRHRRGPGHSHHERERAHRHRAELGRRDPCRQRV